MKDGEEPEPIPVETEEEELVEPVEPIKPEEPQISMFEMQSVGRVYFNLSKPVAHRWKQFITPVNSRKPSQVSLWYEIHEKHELDLVKLDPFSDDDEDML